MNSSTLSAPSPQVNVRHRFAHRQLIKIVAVICEKCGRKTTGKGITRWKCCPRCGATIITSKEQEQRSRWYATPADDEKIYQHHQLSELPEKPAEQHQSEAPVRP